MPRYRNNPNPNIDALAIAAERKQRLRAKHAEQAAKLALIVDSIAEVNEMLLDNLDDAELRAQLASLEGDRDRFERELAWIEGQMVNVSSLDVVRRENERKAKVEANVSAALALLSKDAVTAAAACEAAMDDLIAAVAHFESVQNRALDHLREAGVGMANIGGARLVELVNPKALGSRLATMWVAARDTTAALGSIIVDGRHNTDTPAGDLATKLAATVKMHVGRVLGVEG